MRVVIVGAGGLGSYIGGVLDQAGHDVYLVARGEHRRVIEERGLLVRSHAGDFTARPTCVDVATDVDAVDVTFVVTKTYSLDEVASQLRGVADEGSAVVSLLNGVTAVPRLAAYGIGPELLADGVAYMTAFRTAPGVVERKATHQRIVVPGGNRVPSRRLAELFVGTIVGIQTVEDIRVELWEKLAVVAPLSVLCAFGERTMGSIRRHPFGARLQRIAIAEVLAVGRATGVPIPPEADDIIDGRLDAFPDDFFPSVIHDLNQGRRTEMDDLSGEISRLGELHGVPTPLHEAGTVIVQQAEERARKRVEG
jgi:2-dehydropantoate 2-reductase